MTMTTTYSGHLSKANTPFERILPSQRRSTKGDPVADSCEWFPIPRKDIDAWVAAHRDTLPRTLADLSIYPIPFRKAIVQALPRDTVAGFWREHLLTFIGSDMSPGQNQVIGEAAESIAIIFGESEAAAAGLQALNERVGRLVAEQILTRTQAMQIFATLGPPEPPGGLPIPRGDWSINTG
jgi:hypothetical protein